MTESERLEVVETKLVLAGAAMAIGIIGVCVSRLMHNYVDGRVEQELDHRR